MANDQGDPHPEDEHRVSDRVWILDHVENRGVGAELGVFRGHFSQAICRLAAPRVLYLVDFWWTAWGENYPDWGTYTEHGALRTRDAYDETLSRVRSFTETDIRPIVGSIETFLDGLPEGHLDWVYLDAGHQFEDTLAQLRLAARKLKSGGRILGDDWTPDPTHRHHGVFQAVARFVEEEPFEIIAAGRGKQFCLGQVSAG